MKIAAIVAAGLAAAAVVFVVMLLVVKLMWAWTIPDLFPGAVEQGLVVREISWMAALKIALILAVLGGFFGGASGHHQTRRSRAGD